MKKKFRYMFSPTKIGKMDLKNRIVFPAACTSYATTDGFVTEHLKRYFAKRANGGAGLVIVECGHVIYPDGYVRAGDLSLSDDKYIPGLRELADAVKAEGAKVAMQVAHAGRNSPIKPVAPSPISYAGNPVPHELTVEEIEELVEAFAEGTRRVKEAGFDGAELHFCHGYCGGMFYSPLTNKRTDKYGGDLARRMQFTIEVMRRTREKVGKDYPLWCRINGDDFAEGGQTLDEGKIIAMTLEKEGSDAISVSGNVRESTNLIADASMGSPRGCWVYMAEAIKKVINVPVIAVRRINDPLLAENILEKGKADLVAMARALIADADFPNKIAKGRLDDIRPCIACNLCYDLILEDKPIECSVNPALGKEEEWGTVPADRSKRVIVAGGGPSGMEAAKVLALRGHKVTLFEKSPRLGGQLKFASIIPFRDEMINVTEYYENQLRKLGVEVRLGTECTPEYVEKATPDAVIVATGGEYVFPKIPGIEEGNVVPIDDALANALEIGENVALICPGICCAVKSFAGCQAAAFLAKAGKRVTIVTPFSDILLKLGSSQRKYAVRRYGELGIIKLINVRIKRVTKEGVIWEAAGIERLLRADTLMVAAIKQNRQLAEALKEKVSELYEVGDCVKSGNAHEAIHQGFQVALKI